MKGFGSARRVLGILVAVTALGAAGPAKEKEEAPAPLTQLDLAKSDHFYLVLDPERRVLTLSYHNAPLREYAVESMSVGSRTVLFMQSGAPKDWASHAWASGRLEPEKEIERRELHVTSEGVAVKGETADPEKAPEAPEPPPAPPRSYEIHFAGGFTLEVNAAEPAGLLSRVGGWLGGAAHALIGSDEDRVRLRLKLPDEDAGALYRSLPPEPGFVIASTGS